MSKHFVDLTKSSSPAPAASQSIEGSALERAIDDAQSDRLRTTLFAICNASSEAARIARQLLLIEEPQRVREMRHREAYDGDEEEEQASNTESSGLDDSEDDSIGIRPSHVRPRYATCANCNEEFEVSDNKKRKCRWHSSELEANYDPDQWVDWEEETHGPIDTPENRVEYPEGFIYPCCDEDGTSEGCQVTRHVDKRHKSRY